MVDWLSYMVICSDRKTFMKLYLTFTLHHPCSLPPSMTIVHVTLYVEKFSWENAVQINSRITQMVAYITRKNFMIWRSLFFLYLQHCLIETTPLSSQHGILTIQYCKHTQKFKLITSLLNCQRRLCFLQHLFLSLFVCLSFCLLVCLLPTLPKSDERIAMRFYGVVSCRGGKRNKW